PHAGAPAPRRPRASGARGGRLALGPGRGRRRPPCRPGQPRPRPPRPLARAGPRRRRPRAAPPAAGAGGRAGRRAATPRGRGVRGRGPGARRRRAGRRHEPPSPPPAARPGAADRRRRRRTARPRRPLPQHGRLGTAHTARAGRAALAAPGVGRGGAKEPGWEGVAAAGRPKDLITRKRRAARPPTRPAVRAGFRCGASWAATPRHRSGGAMHPDIQAYNDALGQTDREVADLLARTIAAHLPDAEEKVWHGHPVWFLDGNPTVGYGRLKD